MRQNPHVRICGGPGSATTLVYPTGRKSGEVSVRMSVASCRVSQFGPPGGLFDARSMREEILTRASDGWYRY